jgi:tight adherence protein B
MSPLLLILVLVLAFVTIAGLGFVFVGADPAAAKTAKRTQAIAERTRTDKPRAQRANAQNDPTQRRKQILKTLKDQEKQQRKATLTLTSRMQQAGLGSSLKPFWIGSAVMGAVGLLGPLILGINSLICMGIGFVFGLGLPRWFIGVLAKRRCAKFSSHFADAIDIITRGIKSGLPVHDCLKIIGRESPEPLASEFSRLVEEVGMGVPTDQALEKMYERMPTPELRFFAIVLSIQQKTGGNLAEALSNLSSVLRGRRMMREKVKALSSEALASAFIIGSLPPAVILLITITTPAYMAIMWSDPRGHMLLLVAGGLMSFGIWIMRRMMNFAI